MKLYYSRGSCSLSPDIALREAGLPVELVKVDLRTKRTETDEDFLAINSKGYVPTLELDDGQRLTEGPAILQYVADKVPASGLAPAAGTLERYRMLEWLNFITSELHKQFSPLFDPSVDDARKARQREKVEGRLAWLSQQLGERDYLMANKFSVVDAYLFTVLSWSRHVGIDVSKWPNLARYLDRVAARPKVQEAMRAEGLLKS
jgi:glutathione S-transferase